LPEGPCRRNTKTIRCAEIFPGAGICDIEPDWVLIYTLEENHVRFERTGTHSDIFKN